METKTPNPTAFPTIGWEQPPRSNEFISVTDDPGMTLRDYFAAKAISSLIPVYFDKTNGYCHPLHRLAENAYEIAGAMLIERNKINAAAYTPTTPKE